MQLIGFQQVVDIHCFQQGEPAHQYQNESSDVVQTGALDLVAPNQRGNSSLVLSAESS